MIAAIGFPVLAIYLTRSYCTPGRLRIALAFDYPLKSLPSPRKSKTLSACLAAAIAY